MRELPSRDVRHRVKGKQALEKRLRGLLLAVHRYGRCRARTRAELQWTAKAIDLLTLALNEDGRDALRERTAD